MLREQLEQELQTQKGLLTLVQQEQLQRQQQQHQAQLDNLQVRLEQLSETSETAIREYKSALQVSQGVLQRLDEAGVSHGDHAARCRPYHRSGG